MATAQSQELTVCLPHWLQTQQFEIYSEYCNNHPAACEELRDMYRVKRYRHFFEVSTDLYLLGYVGWLDGWWKY